MKKTPTNKSDSSFAANANLATSAISSTASVPTPPGASAFKPVSHAFPPAAGTSSTSAAFISDTSASPLSLLTDPNNSTSGEDLFDLGVASSALSTPHPPSFVDVYGLHSRPSGTELVKDGSGNSSGSVRDALLTTPSMDVESLEVGNLVGDDASTGDPMASSLSLLPTSSHAPQNMALSLNKQIENVDAGLESIKDALVSRAA